MNNVRTLTGLADFRYDFINATLVLSNLLKSHPTTGLRGWRKHHMILITIKREVESINSETCIGLISVQRKTHTRENDYNTSNNAHVNNLWNYKQST